MEDAIRLGVSSCLLGSPVYHDGTILRDQVVSKTLGHGIEFVAVCPEVECGLPVPREPLCLALVEGLGHQPRLVGCSSREEFTAALQGWMKRRLQELDRLDLDGFIFRDASPCCGLEKVRVAVLPGESSIQAGIGLFAAGFMAHFPGLPVEVGARLHDIDIRENFIERIFVFKRWRIALQTARKRSGLVDFHSTHKYILLAHGEKEYREMGKLVASAKDFTVDELFRKYGLLLDSCLRKKCTIKKHLNVLFHIAGYLKNELSPEEKREVHEIFDLYANGLVPLLAPLTLLKFFVKKYRQEYLINQHYLDPHPVQLRLLNHA